jgi:hypothetical protein
MTPRGCVWTLFLGSAICFVVQIVQDVGRLPDEPVPIYWGVLAVKCALVACLNLADSGAPPPGDPSPRPEEPRHAPTSASTAPQHGARFHRSPVVP